MLKAIDTLSVFDPFAGLDGGARAGYVVLDVFTDVALEGNQLAVFTDARGVPEGEMQSLARELKLSETVFVLPPAGDGDVSIRIFTPGAELAFAGHPVLGTAIAVGNALGLERVSLETVIGTVPVRLRSEDGVFISGWMDQPIPSWAPYERADALLAALGVERSGLPVEIYDNGLRHAYVELDSEQAVAEVRPDLQALGALGAVGANCFAGAGRHWTTRMFMPALGVPEDPATGSAAGPLAVHLCRHGRIAFGEEIEIRQGAEMMRPSLLYALAEGSVEKVERVSVGGSALIVARGEFRISPAER